MSAEDKQNTEPMNVDDLWMIRPCSVYLDEYNECKGFRGRIHQHYITGEKFDCTQWKKDYDTCMAYHKSKSAADAAALIESEKRRRVERLSAMKNNDVWQYRTSPPADWNSPLPEHLQQNTVPSVTGKMAYSCVIS